MAKNRYLFSQKNSIVGVWLDSKYASVTYVSIDIWKFEYSIYKKK